ncbi:MAG: biopolymer transporter ExbD [Phycisphaerae bacterium]
MARVIKAKRRGDVGFNMTPMIDIIFLLIIFFMLVSQFQQLEIEDVVLPVAEAAKVMDYSQYRNIVINIIKGKTSSLDAVVKVMGREMNVLEPYTRPDGSQTVGGELTALLVSMAEQKGKSQLNVILRADADVPYEDVARVMLAAGAAGIEGWWITTKIPESEQE